MALLVMLVPYRMARVTSFLDPWADPFNSGFQLTQSLIAIGRGEWFGVGPGRERAEAVLSARGAHRLPVRRAGRGAGPGRRRGDAGAVHRAGVAQLLDRAARLARRACKFQAYLALGFGLWLGAQALINIGVNMGVLPTKGLTLPLMSYGRSSMIVTLAWVGLLLRVYHEAMQSARGMASARRADEVRAACGVAA